MSTRAALRLVPWALGTALAAFMGGLLWHAGANAAAALLGVITATLLVGTMTGFQLLEARRELERMLRAAERVRVFGGVRLRAAGGRPQAVDYVIVGPGKTAWPVLLAGISQWPASARAKRILGARAAQAAGAAEGLRRALREGNVPARVPLDADAAVTGIVVPLRRRVEPERLGGAVVCNTEELEDVLAGRAPASAPVDL